MTNDGTKIIKENNFDILRLILALLVVFAHWNALTENKSTNFIFYISGYSVAMFFIVSGFLIFWSFDKDNSKKNFFVKRFFRIYPLYLIIIILQTLFFIFYSKETNIFLYIKYFFVNIFYLNFLSPSVGQTLSELHVNAINGSLWTLKIEIMFYLAVPLIYFLYKKIGIIFIIFLYFISFFWKYFMNYLHLESLSHQFPGQLKFFVVGIIFYLLYERINHKHFHLISFISLISLISLIYIKNYSNIHIINFFGPILLGIICFYFVFFIKYIKIEFDFSYSIYVIHFPIIQIVLYFNLNPDNPLLSFCLIICLVFIFGFFLEKYVEKRFINFGKRFLYK